MNCWAFYGIVHQDSTCGLIGECYGFDIEERLFCAVKCGDRAISNVILYPDCSTVDIILSYFKPRAELKMGRFKIGRSD